MPISMRSRLRIGGLRKKIDKYFNLFYNEANRAADRIGVVLSLQYRQDTWQQIEVDGASFLVNWEGAKMHAH